MLLFLTLWIVEWRMNGEKKTRSKYSFFLCTLSWKINENYQLKPLNIPQNENLLFLKMDSQPIANWKWVFVSQCALCSLCIHISGKIKENENCSCFVIMAYLWATQIKTPNYRDVKKKTQQSHFPRFSNREREREREKINVAYEKRHWKAAYRSAKYWKLFCRANKICYFVCQWTQWK